MTQQLQSLIDAAWENRTNLSPKSAPTEVTQAVDEVIAGTPGEQIATVAAKQPVSPLATVERVVTATAGE